MTITFAAPEDTREIYQLMCQTQAAMEYPDWYCIDTEEYISEHITDRSKGIVLKAEENGQIGAFFLIHLPGQDPDNMGHYLNLSHEQLVYTAYMDSAAVHPDFRGRRLQYTMMAEGEQWLKELGYRHLFATVHPENRYSLANLQKLGYMVVTTTEKYGNLPRHIMYKEL